MPGNARFRREGVRQQRVRGDDVLRTRVRFREGRPAGDEDGWRDFAEWTRGFPDESRGKLDQRLRSRLGSGLEEQDQATLNEVRAVLRGGCIKSDDEYRLLLARVEQIYADDSKAEGVGRINELLAVYHRD